MAAESTTIATEASRPALSLPDSAPPTSPARTVFLPSALLLVAMFNQTLCVAGLKELIVDGFGGTTGDASLFFSIESLAYILFAPVWGLLSDRLSRRRVFVVVGFLGSGLIYLAYAWIDTIPMLLAVRFVQGAFAVMGWSTLMAQVLDQPDAARRGRYMGLMGAALIFGVSLGAPVGGYVSRAYGASAPLDLAGWLFLLLAAASLTLNDQRAVRSQVRLSEILGNLTQRPRLLLPYAFQFIDRYTVGLFIVIFPLYLGTLGIADPSVRGRYLAAFLLPFALLQYFTGRMAEKWGPYPPLIWGSLLYGVVLMAVGYSDLQALWWVMSTLGVLAAVMFPPAMLMTAQLSDSSTRGSAMGGFNLAGSLGFALGPICGHWIFELGGFGTAFMVTGLLEVLVVIGAMIAVRRWR